MNPEYPSDHSETPSAIFGGDWIVPCYTLPTAFHFAANSLPSRDDLVTGDQPNAKLPILRIAHPGNSVTSGRVSRAREKCREQKAKCSGHRPACDRCNDAGVRCSYSDRKGKKMAKWVASDEEAAHL
jgi:hypothetical protein